MTGPALNGVLHRFLSKPTLTKPVLEAINRQRKLPAARGILPLSRKGQLVTPWCRLGTNFGHCISERG
jgi:hypothetical protein